MERGTRVKFVGLNPRQWETEGTVVEQIEGPLYAVTWDTNPSRKIDGTPKDSLIHKSQLEAL